MQVTCEQVNLIPPPIPSHLSPNSDFTPIESQVRKETWDTFTISQDGHYIGHDGFVVPKDFAEFYERFPDRVRGQVRCRRSACSEAERKDRESELLLFLMTIPEGSKYRETGYNGLPGGCTDRIQVFDPRLSGGANAARFFAFINKILQNRLTALVEKAFSNPINRYSTLSLNSAELDGDVIDEEYLSEFAGENSAVNTCCDRMIENCILIDEFFAFVRRHNPKLIPVLKALQTADTLVEAQKALGLTERTFFRARNRLVVLSSCFRKGDTPPRQRKVYRTRTDSPADPFPIAYNKERKDKAWHTTSR